MLSKPVYLSFVKKIQFGKSLPDSVYLHRDYLEKLPLELKRFVFGLATTLDLTETDWDVIKLFKHHFKVSLLSYPDFYIEPYPELKKAYTVDLEALKTKESCYLNSKNPPILHRKELFIPEDNPYFRGFSEITQEGEQIGLYKQTSKIGFKNGWLKTIREHGYELVDGELMPLSLDQIEETSDNGSEIDRHKTALTRYEFSLPFKKLFEHDLVSGDLSVFDYGCGKGSDLFLLKEAGINSSGWDPAFSPDSRKVKSDVVNLGFVLNVIEDYDERVDALLSAWDLTNKVLCISVMVTSESYIRQFEPYKDGVITSRNTFQKYYSQKEIRSFIEEYLMTDTYTVAPGVILVFRNPDDAINFEQSKIKRSHNWQHFKISRISQQDILAKLISNNEELFDALWKKCLEFGRPLKAGEFERENELIELTGSIRKAQNILMQFSDMNTFELASNIRKEDLIYFFGMSLFQKRQDRKISNPRLLNDIKFFFKNKTSAELLAREHLEKLPEPSTIEHAATSMMPAAIPHTVNEQHSIIFHKKFINEIPLLLRLYVGCASILYGGLDEIDLIKVHFTSGKVSFMGYDEFDTAVMPKLRERIKVNLWNQHVDYFDYLNEARRPLLFNSSKYVRSTDKNFKNKNSFDTRLKKIIPDIDHHVSLNTDKLNDVLSAKGFILKGSKFFKI